jgi:hypothetical protein
MQCNGGSWKKLATVCIWMTRCAVPAQLKECGRKGLTVEKRQRRGPECKQWNKRLRRKLAATSEEGEDIRQDLQEDSRAGDRKANSRVFDWVTGSESLDIVEGSRPSPETKKETSKAQPSET